MDGQTPAHEVSIPCELRRGKRKLRSIVKLVPKSGTHRQIVRDEFFQGLSQLTGATRTERAK